MAVHKCEFCGRPPLCDYAPALLSGSLLIIGVADSAVARCHSRELSESNVFGDAEHAGHGDTSDGWCRESDSGCAADFADHVFKRVTQNARRGRVGKYDGDARGGAFR
jgi:hypothetical protein